MNCYRCNKFLEEGELKYIVNISITADFDGVLKEDTEEEIEDILKKIERLDEYDLERDVYENMVVILCKRCKDFIIDEIKGKYLV